MFAQFFVLLACVLALAQGAKSADLKKSSLPHGIMSMVKKGMKSDSFKEKLAAVKATGKKPATLASKKGGKAKKASSTYLNVHMYEEQMDGPFLDCSTVVATESVKLNYCYSFPEGSVTIRNPTTTRDGRYNVVDFSIFYEDYNCDEEDATEFIDIPMTFPSSECGVFTFFVPFFGPGDLFGITSSSFSSYPVAGPEGWAFDSFYETTSACNEGDNHPVYQISYNPDFCIYDYEVVCEGGNDWKAYECENDNIVNPASNSADCANEIGDGYDYFVDGSLLGTTEGLHVRHGCSTGTPKSGKANSVKAKSAKV